MREHDEQQAELLDRYWQMLEREPDSAPPVGLDPELATTTRRLIHRLRPLQAQPAFAAQLGQRLAAEAASLARQPDGRPPAHAIGWPWLRRIGHPRRWWPLAGLATAAVLVLAIARLATWITRPPAVSAQEILVKAQAAAADSAAGGVRSFVLTEVLRARSASVPPDGNAGSTTQEQSRLETTHWYEAPNHWRIESKGTVLDANGHELPDRGWQRINVSDGTDIWSYDVLHKEGQVNRLDPAMGGKGGVARFGEEASDLEEWLRRAGTCGTPVLRGSEMVAGRSTYVIDLGASKCPSASTPEINGPSTVWVDKETFFVLKHVQYSGLDGQLLSTREVTSVQYNVQIDPARFTFTPPADAKVQDLRPQPAPGSHQPLPSPTPMALAEIRRRVSFAVLVPTWVPAGLTPEPPVGGERPESNVHLSYHATDGSVALTVLNGPAGCCLAADPRKMGEPVTLPTGTPAHFLAIQPQLGGPILWWEQDGTYVALSGPQLTRDELVRIAASMSKTADLGRTEAPPARPTPTPVSAPSFAILRPTWLPEPMTVREEAIPNPNGPGSGIVLSFDPRPGDKPHELLTLRELPMGQDQAQMQDPQATREQIGGREVTIVRRGEGCVLASWVQDDVALTLTNPYDPPGPPGAVRYSCDQLRHIIESIRPQG